MLNSRKLFKALAVTGLLTLGSVASYAQSCLSFSTNIGLRPEGITENVGDVSVSGCSAALPPSFSVLVQMPPSFVITNGTGAAQQPTITLPGATVVATYPAALPNAISFEVTGASGTAFTITGIRVNVANAVAGGFATGGQVTASIIVSTASTIISVSNPNPVVGTVLPVSLTYSVAPLFTGSNAFSTCVSQNGVAGFLKFVETFAGILRTKTGPNSEDGGVVGSATTGTQVRFTVPTLPAGIALYLPNQAITTGGQAVPANQTVLTPVSGIGAAASGLTTSYTPLPTNDPAYGGTYGPVTAGTTVYYEVTTASPGTVDTLNIPFIVKYTAGPTVGTGTVTSAGGLGPQAAGAFPRFADVTTNANLFTSSVCSTTLLYPYVTTDAGFDTGLAISNTTADDRTTANQSGTCTITPFGTTSSGGTLPAAGTTPAINAGRTWAFSATDSAVFGSGAKLGTGFNGYIIASCNFQLGHGYAFISTYGLAGANSVAQGYLALVVPGLPRAPTTGTGVETLGH